MLLSAILFEPVIGQHSLVILATVAHSSKSVWFVDPFLLIGRHARSLWNALRRVFLFSRRVSRQLHFQDQVHLHFSLWLQDLFITRNNKSLWIVNQYTL